MLEGCFLMFVERLRGVVLWLCVLQSAAEDEPQWSKRLLWNTVGRMGGAVALYFAAIGFLCP